MPSDVTNTHMKCTCTHIKYTGPLGGKYMGGRAGKGKMGYGEADSECCKSKLNNMFAHCMVPVIVIISAIVRHSKSTSYCGEVIKSQNLKTLVPLPLM